MRNLEERNEEPLGFSNLCSSSNCGYVHGHLFLLAPLYVITMILMRVYGLMVVDFLAKWVLLLWKNKAIMLMQGMSSCDSCLL